MQLHGVKVLARVVFGVLGFCVSVVALGYVSSLLEEPASPASQLTQAAGEPWVRQSSGLSGDLDEAAVHSPRGNLSVIATLNVTAPSAPHGYGRARLSVSVTGPADDPLVRAIRAGRARGHGDGLAWLLGVSPNLRWGVTYGDPRTSVSSGLATVRFEAAGDVLVDGTTTVTFDPSYRLCDRLAGRTITVVGSGLLVSSVAAGWPPQGEWSDCGVVGGWRDQSPTLAVFRGAGQARIELVPDTAATPADPSRSAPLLEVGREVSGLIQTVGYAVLAPIPLFLAWRRLRPRLSGGATPGRSLRRWSAGDDVGSRTATVLGMLLILHVLVGVSLVLANVLSIVNNGVASRSLLDLLPPVVLAPAALMVALALVWRRAALNGVRGRPRMGADIAVLVVAGLVVLVVPGVVWHASLQSVDKSVDSPSWWLTRPGFLVLFIGALHVAALVGVLAARRLGASNRALGRVAWAAPLVMAAGFVVLGVQGMTWIPPDDGTAPATWAEWLATWDGILPLLLTMAAGLVPAAICVLVWRPGLRAAIRGWPTPVQVGLGIVAAGAVAALVYTVLLLAFSPLVLSESYNWDWLSAEPSWTDWYHGQVGHLTALYLATLAAVIGIIVLGRSLRLGARDILTAVAGVVLVAALFLVEPLTHDGGLLANIVGAVVPLTASVLVWLTIDRAVRHAVNADPPDVWDRMRPKLRRWRGLRVVVALLLSLPFVVYGGEWGPRISWYDFSTFASSIDNALPLIGLALLVLLLRHLGTPASGAVRGSLALLRTTTVLIAVVGLLTPTVTVAGLPIAFLVGWLLFEVWLLPRRAGGTERPVVGEQAQGATADAVTAVVGDVVVIRAQAALEKELRQQLAEDKPTEQEQDRRLSRVTDLTMRRGSTTRAQRREALSSYGGHSAWRRACEFAVIGFVVGLPWTVLDIAAVLNTLTAGGPFRLVDAAAGMLVILRFAIAGLVMGGAYPLIRGATGLGKGLSLFVALAGPALCVTLLPDPRADNALAGALLQLAQWLSFGLVIGLTADWLTLRRHGYGPRHLRELHRMNTLTASASTLLLAVLTAAATAVGSSAAGVFVDRVLTPPPTTPVIQSDTSSGG